MIRTVVAVDPKAKLSTAVTVRWTPNLLGEMMYNYSSTNYNTPFIAHGFYVKIHVLKIVLMSGYVGFEPKMSLCYCLF